MFFVLFAAAFAWWLRAYWGRWQRMYQGVLKTFKFMRQVRDATKSGGFTVRGTGFGGSQNNPDFSKTRQDKTVDVNAKMTVKVGCPVCQEMLSEAQLEAMRTSQLRCPAMIERNVGCPYYGRSLN